MIRDSYRLRLVLFVSGLATFSLSTYLSYLYPPPICDWFYYGFIAKYYSEHGDYPKTSWWRKDQPPFIYRSPIIPLCSLVVDPKGGPKSDYRFLIALAFGILGATLSFLIEPRMGSVVPWVLTVAYTTFYAYFLGGKRTICLFTYPVLGVLSAKSLITGRVNRRKIILSACIGTITGMFYDGWLEVLPLLALPILVPDIPLKQKKTFLTVLGSFLIGATITIIIPNPNISASHGLLTYHRPGLVLHLLGNVSEWCPPSNFVQATILWFFLVGLPIMSGILAKSKCSIKLKFASITYTSISFVIQRLGITYLVIIAPLWYEIECSVLMTMSILSIFQVEKWKKFWEKYPDWNAMKPVILKNLKHGEPWGGGPPFEAWLYYKVDRVPARVTPYDMDWRGYERPIKVSPVLLSIQG